MCRVFKINLETEGKIETGERALFSTPGGGVMISSLCSAGVDITLKTKLLKGQKEVNDTC